MKLQEGSDLGHTLFDLFRSEMRTHGQTQYLAADLFSNWKTHSRMRLIRGASVRRDWIMNGCLNAVVRKMLLKTVSQVVAYDEEVPDRYRPVWDEGEGKLSTKR